MSEANCNQPSGSVFDLDCCPHCQGTGGFNYRITMRGTQWSAWKARNENDNYFDHDQDGVKHGAYRCEDCGKIIKQNTENTTSSERG